MGSVGATETLRTKFTESDRQQTARCAQGNVPNPAPSLRPRAVTEVTGASVMAINKGHGANPMGASTRFSFSMHTDRRPTVADSVDVVVVGMGPAGEEVAGRLAERGLHVVGVESTLVGGECPYWGCVPSKMMIRASNLLAEGAPDP